MITYPNLNEDPGIIKLRTKHDENKNLKYKTENMIMKIF